MAIFDDLVTDVYTITKRPDLISDTEAAVKAATLKVHQLDYFSQDLVLASELDLGSSDYQHSYNYVSGLTNFRRLKYISRLDTTGDLLEDGTFLDIIEIDEMLDTYGIMRKDIAYTAGNAIVIRAEVDFRYALIAYYKLPIVIKATYASWIADSFPNSIVYEAARRIFLTIGYQEQSASMRALVAEEYSELKSSNLPVAGY